MTKYLLLLILLAVVFYKLTARRDARPGSQQPSAPGPAPAPMPPKTIIACAHCGVHLPVDEALPGRGGSFCSASHRAAFEALNA